MSTGGYWEAGATTQLEQILSDAGAESDRLCGQQSDFEQELLKELAGFQLRFEQLSKQNGPFEDVCVKLEMKLDNCSDQLNLIQDEDKKRSLREHRKAILKKTEQLISADGPTKRGLKALTGALTEHFGEFLSAAGGSSAVASARREGSRREKEMEEKERSHASSIDDRQEASSSTANACGGTETVYGGHVSRNGGAGGGGSSDGSGYNKLGFVGLGGRVGLGGGRVGVGGTESCSADRGESLGERANRFIEQMRTLGHEARVTGNDDVETHLVALCEDFGDFVKGAVQEERSNHGRQLLLPPWGSGLPPDAVSSTLRERKDDWIPALRLVDNSIDRLRARRVELLEGRHHYGDRYRTAVSEELQALDDAMMRRQMLLSDMARICKDIGIRQ